MVAFLILKGTHCERRITLQRRKSLKCSEDWRISDILTVKAEDVDCIVNSEEINSIEVKTLLMSPLTDDDLESEPSGLKFLI